MSEADPTSEARAVSRLVVSYDPAEFDDISRFWMENELGSDDYAAYLLRAHDTASEGDEWKEFVSKGCSLPMDVTLRVERVEGGRTLGSETDIEVRSRD